jgi:signal transduction histidine kinase
MGLSAMEERVRPFHGIFSLTARPGEGTQIAVTIPLHFTPLPAEPG